MNERWYLCRLNGTMVKLWGPQIAFFSRFYGAENVMVIE